ncbi:Uncharacterized protein FWK35_00029365 [Aphis craccivora]|uniref:Uncharacterized protein n=1 Tax=Aphis craccivora TaxID=307492 RepID=A0A6G0XFY1_APHCR|nr:Uncharacterized protein FWK35_00029365 [Aphis craccivora]
MLENIIGTIAFHKHSQVTILDSERSDECIDFTMMCVLFFFFLSVYSITILDSVRSDEYIDFTMMCFFLCVCVQHNLST